MQRIESGLVVTADTHHWSKEENCIKTTSALLKFLFYFPSNNAFLCEPALLSLWCCLQLWPAPYKCISAIDRYYLIAHNREAGWTEPRVCQRQCRETVPQTEWETWPESNLEILIIVFGPVASENSVPTNRSFLYEHHSSSEHTSGQTWHENYDPLYKYLHVQSEGIKMHPHCPD